MQIRERFSGVSVFLIAFLGLSSAFAAAQTNPIVLENQQPGSTGWEIDFGRSGSDAVGQIKGYPSATSVNKGDNITFHVSVNPSQTFTIDVYRLGWYGGLGARLMQHIGPLNGIRQPSCPVNATTGLIECQWAPSHTLTVPASWTTGVYIAILTNAQNFQNQLTFVVRDDSRVGTIVYQQPITTYHAYNDYPYDQATGKSLYAFNSYGPNTIGGSRAAVKVSFDRPFSGDGDCQPWGHCVLAQEAAFIRWVERSGYDVTYITDIDTHTDGARLLNHRALISPGHDEYWSKQMFDAVVAARDTGVNLGFFSANTAYTQVRFEPSSTGVANRVMVCYREPDLDPISDPALKTVNFRDAPVNRPEQTLVGVMYTNQVAADAQGRYARYVVQNSTNWVYNNTGFRDGDTVVGLVGYEADRLFSEFPGPTAVADTYTLLSRSPFSASGGSDYGNSSIYQAPSGAWVFGSGTINWGYALDSYGGANIVDARIQKMTQNILDRFAGVPTDFNLLGSPGSQIVTPGAATAYSITVNRTGGFIGAVELSVTGLPVGATATFSPSTVTGTSSTLTITTTPTAPIGNYPLTVTGVSGSLSHSASPLSLTISVNTAPTISNILDRTIGQGSSTGAVAFTVGDTETPAANLTLIGTSSNTALVPNANIVFGGTGANRTVTVTPVASGTGSATITVTVSDGDLNASDVFALTVSATGTYLFTESFEGTGYENGGWSTGGAVNPDYTTNVLDGTQSLNTIGNQHIVRSFQFGNAFYMYFKIRWNAWTDYENIVLWEDASWNSPAGLFADDNKISISHGTVAVLGTTSIATNSTYHVWVEWTKGTGTNGTMKLFVSTTGTKPSTPEASITNGNGAATARMYLGAFSTGPNIVFDKILIDDVEIGSNPGTGGNQPPTISNIADQTITQNGSTGSMGFTVGDGETPVANLTLTGSSSNTTLVPQANILFGGSGANRTVTVTPAANQTGMTTITVTVSDGTLTASDTFVVTVNPPNTAPTVSNIADQVTNEDSATGLIAFIVADTETAAGSLTLTGSSSNLTLVPSGNIVFGGAGGNRTVNVTPSLNQSGSATITVTVSDGSLSASDTFLLTVNPVNDSPTITNLGDVTVPANTSTAAIPFAISDVETAAASLTLSAVSSNSALVPNGNIIFGGTGANRTVTVTPAANQSGTTTVTVTVSDGSATASDTFVLTVTPPNAAPTISDVADQVTNEDTSTGVIAFTIDDAETSAATLTLTGSSLNQSLVLNGNIVFGGSGANRTVTVTPVPNQSGTVSISVTVSDGSLTATDTFLVTVNPVNDAPTISNIIDASTTEGSASAPLAFVVADTETAAATLTLTATSSNTALVPSGNIIFGGAGGNRTVTVTPASGQTGTTTIAVTVSDGDLSATDTFVLTVLANTPPTLSNLSDLSTNEDVAAIPTAFVIGDAETAAAGLVLSATSSNALLVPNGNIAFSGTGANRTVSVTPAANQSGSATITITVSDGSLSASDTFVLTVNPVNDSPSISNIADVTIAENTSTAAIAFTVNDVEEPAGLTLSASSTNTSLVPLANILFGGSGTSRTVTVTPAASQSGSATIAVTVSDGVATASDTFVLTVTAVNDPPTISDIADQTTNEDTATGPVTFTVGDAETAAASLTMTALSSNTALVPVSNVLLGGSGANRTVTVTPAANQFGTAMITITVSDGSLTATDTFVVIVNGLNDLPTISNIADRSIPQNTSTGAIAFSVADIETAAGSLTVSGASSNPALVPDANIVFGGSGGNRTITLTPAAGQTGTATITITVHDGEAIASDSFVLTVTVGNTPPTISNITDLTINEDGTTGALPFTVGDAETAASSLTVTRATSNTTLVPLARVVLGGSGVNRTVTVTPAANLSGTATITVVVSDGSLTATDTFVVTVNPINDAPTITDIGDQTIAQNTSTSALAFTVADLDTAAGSLTVSGSSSNTTLVPNGNITMGGSGGNRTVTVTPAANQTGTATITVTVSDGTLTNSDTFVVNVTADGTPSYSLSEGFEGVGFENNGWSSTGAANPDYTAAPLDGLQSLSTNGGQYIWRNFASSSSFYMYFQVRWNTWTDFAGLLHWDNASWGTAAGLWAGDNYLYITHGSASANGKMTIDPGTTYHVWVEWSKGTGSNGTMKLFVSPTATKPAAPDASITTGKGTATARMYVGPTGTGPSVLFDRILVANSPIGSNP
jgi:hypothetical protein